MRSPKGEFVNEPFVNFAEPENARAMRAALDHVGTLLGREYDLIIGGHREQTVGKITSLNPARPAQVVGVHQKAGSEHAQDAMDAALRAFHSWSRVPVEVRASLLLRAAEIIRERKFEFSAWLTYEVGKNWAEADADTAETIDFLEFYAREALRLAQATTPIQYPGERNRLLYIPLGVGAVIPPWNFPFAIMAGMTAASIVTGNTVILKPSSDSPTIAAMFMEVLEEAGMPAGVVNFCPGSGATFGNAIVEHPKTRFIAFTGSKAVGLDIHELAAKTQKGQIWIKRTVLEMGGKDSILVCADADVEAAADGVVAAAFGFSGQKCSACSRAIIDATIYDEFVEKVRLRVAKLRVGDPVENPQHGTGGQPERDGEHPRVHCEGQGRGTARCRRRVCGNAFGWVLHPANGLCGYRSGCGDFAGRDFWAGAGADQGGQLRGRPCGGEQYRVRPYRSDLYR